VPESAVADGKVLMVTGATRGIGLAASVARVKIAAVRDVDVGGLG